MYLVMKIFWTLIEVVLFPFGFIAKKFHLYNWKVYEYVILLNMMWLGLLLFSIISTIFYLAYSLYD